MMLGFPKESDDDYESDKPVITVEAPSSGSSRLSMQLVLILFVFIVLVGYFVRRYILRRQEAEDKEFNA